MKYLCQTQEIYRVDSESEATALIEEAKKDSRFTLLKSATEYQTTKAKGEIIDEYWKVTLTKNFTDLKNPDCSASVNYFVDKDYFDNCETCESAWSSDPEVNEVTFTPTEKEGIEF